MYQAVMRLCKVLKLMTPLEQPGHADPYHYAVSSTVMMIMLWFTIVLITKHDCCCRAVCARIGLTYLQGWLYLEPIFGSEDILQQMPNEGRKFRAVDATWRRIMTAVRKAPEVLVMCSDDELLKNLIEANKFLEQVQLVAVFLLYTLS